MRRIVSLALSLALVLSLCVGFFSFTASAADLTTKAAKPASKLIVKLDGETEETVLTEATSMAAGSGTIAFDPATGTATLTNATASYIYSPSGAGALTVILVGTNTLTGYHAEYFTLRGWDGLTIDGSGALTIANGKQYVIGTITGDLVFRGMIDVNVTATVADAIHQGGNKVDGFADGNIIFEETAVVTAKAPSNTVRSQQVHGTLIVKDGAKLNATATAIASWKSVVKTSNYLQLGGDVVINGTSSNQSVIGLYVEADSATASSAHFVGGSLNISVESTHASSRAYGIFMKYGYDISFEGTDVSIALTNADTNVANQSAGVALQSGWGSDTANYAKNAWVSITGGSLTMTGNAQYGIYTDNRYITVAAGELSISGSYKYGLRAYRYYLYGGTFDISVTYSALDGDARIGGNGKIVANSETNKSLGTIKNFTSSGKYPNIIVNDADGSHTLDPDNDYQTNNGGTVSFDPATLTVTMSNAALKSITTTECPLNLVVEGTCSLDNGSANQALKSDSSMYHNYNGLTIGGTGTLTAKGASYVIMSQTGNMTFKDSVTVNVTGTNQVLLLGDSARSGRIVVTDNAKVTVNCTTSNVAVAATGPAGQGLTIEKNGQLTASSNGDAIQFNHRQASYIGETVGHTKEVVVCDNGRLTIPAGNCGIRITNPEDKYYFGLPTAHKEIEFKDNAVVDITAKGQVLYLYGITFDSGAEKASNCIKEGYFNIRDNANVKLTNTSGYAVIQSNMVKTVLNVTDSAKLDASIALQANSSGMLNFNGPASGTVEMNLTSDQELTFTSNINAGWLNAFMYASPKYTVNITSDVTVNATCTNNTSFAFELTGAAGSVVNITDGAHFTANAVDSANASTRAAAIYIANGATLNVSGEGTVLDAKVTTKSDATLSGTNVGSAMAFNYGTLNVLDGAVVNLKGVNPSCGILLDDQYAAKSSVNVDGGELNIEAPTAGIWANYRGGANSKGTSEVNVLGGALTIKSAIAAKDKNGNAPVYNTDATVGSTFAFKTSDIAFVKEGALEGSATTVTAPTFGTAYLKVDAANPNGDVKKDSGDEYLTAETFKAFDFQGVQIRRTAPTGLRFLATISQEFIDELGDKYAGVGFILALETAYTGELVYDATKTGSISAGGIVKAPCTTFWTEDDDFGYEIFTVVISGLDNNLETRISARPYVELKDGTMIYLDLTDDVAVTNATYANGTYTTCVSDVAKYLVSISDEQQKATYSKFIAEDPE